MPNWLVLAVLLVLSLVSRSTLVAYAALVLLAMQALGLERFFPSLRQTGIPVGLFFLTLAVLVPLAQEKRHPHLLASLLSPAGLMAIVGGALAAYLSARGVGLLTARPEIVLGLAVGIILGIWLLKGLPVGPLVAAGLAAILLDITR
ncbi:MAG: DUF441 domain-containing protein [Firmicutes bacterium]|nr:DUF441 domain-containing protein [Bacillota bacterium]